MLREVPTSGGLKRYVDSSLALTLLKILYGHHHTIHHAVQQHVNSYHGHSWTIHLIFSLNPEKIQQLVFFEKIRPNSAESFGYTQYISIPIMWIAIILKCFKG